MLGVNRGVQITNSSTTKGRCLEKSEDFFAECHKTDNLRPCENIQVWILPKQDTQTLWPQPDTNKFNVLLRCLSSCLQADLVKAKLCGLSVTMDQCRLNDVLCLCWFVCVCVSRQRWIWTGRGERLPSAPWNLPWWDILIIYSSFAWEQQTGQNQQYTYSR